MFTLIVLYLCLRCGAIERQYSRRGYLFFPQSVGIASAPIVPGGTRNFDTPPPFKLGCVELRLVDIDFHHPQK